MATLLPNGKQQFDDNGGVPLVGGKLYTYDAGTTNPRTTYQDAAGTIPNTNPIILDARGEATIFWDGAYKAVLKTAADVTIWTVDGINQPTNSTVSTLTATTVNTTTLNATTVNGAVHVGGSGANSDLVLQTTTGAGTQYPATTTDNIVFRRGNNGAQMVGQFSPGGSFGVGDWSRWPAYSVNEHAGDDGTTTRVCSVMAETAALFVGQTVRNNAESGGPVGRSVVSFEGYRLANDAGSRESGAVRVITEGVSANQLGARVSILTRRDGFTEADFVERWDVQNDGNVYHGGGNGGVGNANRSGYAYGNTVYTISGQTGRSVIEQTTNAADADQTIIGDHSFLANFQTDEKRIALMQGVLAGTTATKRGGELRWYLKPDNSGLTEVFRMTAYGVKDAKPQGTLQAAPTLAITANAITPAAPISFVGAGLIKNITVPANFAGHGGRITIIPTAAFTTDATGNIAVASTAVISRAMDFIYDGATAKWYPSYV